MTDSLSIVDCHTHLYPPQFTLEEIRDMHTELIHSFNTSFASPTRYMAIGTPESLEDCRQVLALSKKLPWILPCAGLHPIQPAHSDPNGQRERIVTLEDVPSAREFILRNQEDLVAIGEVGLDFSLKYLKTPFTTSTDVDAIKDTQRRVLTEFAQLSQSTGLPMNVHSRDAGRHAIDLLKYHTSQNVLLHAFNAKASTAMNAVSLSSSSTGLENHEKEMTSLPPMFYFSIPPNIIRSPVMQKWASIIPLDRLVLETDVPALSPDPVSRNKLVNIRESVTWLANARNMDVDEILKLLEENTMKLFPKVKQRLEREET